LSITKHRPNNYNVQPANLIDYNCTQQHPAVARLMQLICLWTTGASRLSLTTL